MKFKPDVHLPYSSTDTEVFFQRLGPAWDQLNTRFQGLRLVPYFTTIDVNQRLQFELGETRSLGIWAIR